MGSYEKVTIPAGDAYRCADCRTAIWRDPKRPGRWIAADDSKYCNEFSVLGGYCPPDHAPREGAGPI